MKKLKKFLKNDFFILGTIIIFGFILRIYNLKDNFIFAYDQARDAQRIWEIFYERNLKIVGPETDIPGVFNGPLLYYILLPFYLISNFDPNLAAVIFVFINLSAIPLFYFISMILFDNRKVGYFAGLLWSISFAQLNFARFISNASPMSITSLGFFLTLAWYIFKRKKTGLLLSVVFLSAAIHFNFYLIYLVLIYPITYFIFRPKLEVKPLIQAILLLFLLNLNFIIGQFKWKFITINAFINYFSTQSEKKFSIVDSLSTYLQRIAEANYYSFFSLNIFLAFLIFLFLYILFIKKLPFLPRIKIFFSIWLFSTLPLFGFQSGVINGTVINTTIFPPLTLLYSLSLYYFAKNKIYRLLFFGMLSVILFSNFLLSRNDNFLNIKLFALQPLIFSDQKKLIDYTYKSNKKEMFAICAVTNPLFINTLWSFLYKFYGEPNYGYLPQWSGQKQFLNKNFLPYQDIRNPPKIRYIIIEPTGGMPEFAVKTTIYLEDRISDLIEERNFGHIKVQKRILNPKKNALTDTQNLSPEEIKIIETIIKTDPRYSCFN